MLRTAQQRGNSLAAAQGRQKATAMLPSLQESLDGDEKELESSEEGGSAEERRFEPPPSSHYCLYGYRGSRCPSPAKAAQLPQPPHPEPTARPCTPSPAWWPGRPQMSASIAAKAPSAKALLASLRSSGSCLGSSKTAISLS